MYLVTSFPAVEPPPTPPSYLMDTRGRLFPPGVKRRGLEADHSSPTNADVKNMCSYTSTPRLHGLVLRFPSRYHYKFTTAVYEGVSKSFRTGRLERELQMV
jgi:hypothetical protein